MEFTAAKETEESESLESGQPRRGGWDPLAWENFGLLVVTAAFLLLVPLFELADIPFRFAVTELSTRYIGVAVYAIAWAAVLSAIQAPDTILKPFTKCYRESWERLLILVALIVLIFTLGNPVTASVFSIAAIAILETHNRRIPWRTLRGVVLPSVYLFCGLVTVFAYNVLAVTIRFKPNFDTLVARVDYFLLFGHTLQQVAHAFAASVPSVVLSVLRVSYFELFSQIGATIILCSLAVGQRYAMRFVSTILIAYLVGIGIFFVFPVHSPYFTCTDHMSSRLPNEILTVQQALKDRAELRWEGRVFPIQPEYFVGFPCMHFVQAVIVLWFVRGWRRIFWCLLAFDVVLTAAIVLLEWHYVTDLVGGIGVAVLAIAVTERLATSRNSFAH